MNVCKRPFSVLHFTHSLLTLTAAIAMTMVSFSATADDANTSSFLSAPAGGVTDFHIVLAKQLTPGGGIFSSTPFGDPYNLYQVGNTLDYQSVEVQPEGTQFSIAGWAFKLHGNVPFPAGSLEVTSYYWTLNNVIVIDRSGGPYAPGTAALVPIPEPATFAMLLAGLGLIGTMARQHKHRA